MNTSATTVEPLSAEARWNNAVEEIRENGVELRENIDDCCPSCVREELYDLFMNADKTLLLAWTFGGDGHAYEWDDDTDTMVYQDDRDPIESIHFHQGIYYDHTGSGSVVAAAFRANGFLVRWDGGDWSLIEVFPNGK